MNKTFRIMVIEDNPDDRMLMLRALRKELPGLEAVEVLDEESMLAALEREPFELAVTDYQLQWSDGLTTLDRLKAKRRDCPVIMFTDSGNEEVAVQAFKGGADDYIRKTQANFPRLASSARALIEKRREFRQSQELEFRLQDLLSRLHVGFCRSEPDGTLLYANPPFKALFGLNAEFLYGPLKLQHLMKLPGTAELRLEDLRRHGQARFRDIRGRGAAPTWYSVTQILTQLPDGSATVETLVEDVSERKRMDGVLRAKEEEIRQLQKLDSIGRLAGGVAHDFNNLLTAINGYSELLMELLGPENPFHDSVREINRAGTRAAALTQDLLAFSRKQMLRPEAIDLGAWIEKRIPDLQARLGPHHELLWQNACREPLIVLFDPKQLGIAFGQLIDNSLEAMPEYGRLGISLERLVVPEADPQAPAKRAAAASSMAEPGAYALLHIEDTGRGIDAATLTRIFEPFFTTKPLGKSTGLGLATVYGLVSQMGGHISVESQVGEGTCFRILLPVHTLE
jgi:two-component system cell cycle sensor histidine kinase/response regulator CckA